MSTPRPAINTELLRQLLPGTGEPTPPDETPAATVTPQSNTAALASLGQLVLALIPFAVSGLVVYGAGLAVLYALRQTGMDVLPQPWWGTLIFGALAVGMWGGKWKSK